MSQVKLLSPDIDLISGDDALTVPVMSIGGTGVISVLSNILPKVVADLVNAMANKEYDKARELHFKWLPLIKAMFMETNPIPVKTAMSLMGICSDEMRLPMCKMSEEHIASLKDILKKYNLI